MNLHLKYNYYIMLVVVFGGFFIFGISENIKGPAIPRIQSDFGVGAGELGFLLAINAFGYLLACLFASSLAAKIGIKAVTILSFASMFLSGFLIYISMNFTFLAVAYFLMYVGNGMLEISLAIIAAKTFTKNTGTMMNLAHFFYGLSSTAAPVIAASVMGWTILGSELDWRGMYVFMLSFSLLPIIPALFGRFPGDDPDDENRISFNMFMKDSIAWLIVLILSFGVIAEMGMTSWLVNYLVKVYDWELEEGSRMLSAFFLFFMLARLLLGPLIDRFGYLSSVMLLSAFAGTISIAAILMGEEKAILFAVAGIGIAPVYPTMMALIASEYRKTTSTAITFVAVFVGIGAVIGNLLIGYIIEWVNILSYGRESEAVTIGMQAGYGFIAFSALLCAFFSIVLYRKMKKQPA